MSTRHSLQPFSAIAYLEALLQLSLTQNISDIHIEPQTDHWQVRYRQDGLLYLHGALSVAAGQSLVSRIKVLAKCDIAEKRLPQDGGFNQGQQDYRISTCPTVTGEKVVLRCLRPNQSRLSLADLGFDTEQLACFQHHLKKPHGLILVTGPTGSGKTLTLYNTLLWLQTIHINIITVEDPVEIYLPGINQIAIQAKTGLSFAQALRTLLRQDPDIVMIGEMRDKETIEIALHAAQTGHLVLSTLHTNNAYEAIIRLLQMGIAPYQISSSVRLIIAQRLIRTLCPQCHTLQPCSACQQGYLGRTGIFELLAMTDALSALIHQGAHRSSLKQYQQQQGLMTLRQHGLRKVQLGLSDEVEIQRVIGDE